jgi:hypothetical protein
MNNLICFSHRNYKGESGPDLTCKTCCGIFVARIRAEQNARFEELTVKMSAKFTPFSDMKIESNKSSFNQVKKFDGSWI